MNRGAAFTIFILLLGTSYFLYLENKRLNEKASLLNFQQNDNDIERMTLKLKTLTDNELQEYISLKNTKEKYQKADELIGKMFKILLADLALNLSPPQRNWVEADKEKLNQEKNQEELSQRKEVEVIVDPYKNKGSDNIAKYQGTQNVHVFSNGGKNNRYLRFFDRLKRHELRSIGNDVKRTLLLAKQPLSTDDLIPLNYENAKFYEGEFTGYFRKKNSEWLVSGANQLEKVKGKNYKVEASFKLFGSGNVYIKDKLGVYLPKKFSLNKYRTARAIVLNNEDFQIHIINIPASNQQYVRVFHFGENGIADLGRSLVSIKSRDEFGYHYK